MCIRIILKPVVISFLIMSVFSGCSTREEGPEFVHDQIGLLKKGEHARIVDLNRALLRDLDIHIMTFVLGESPSDINQKAVEIFEAHALGEKTRGSKGVLFLIDPAGKEVRLEIGYDLEPLFPDGFVGYIERKQMVPFFKNNKIGPGIEATVELLVAKAFGAIQSSAYAVDEEIPNVGNQYSGGGGARTIVEIGSGGLDKTPTPLADDFGPQPTPIRALEKYKQVLLLHVKDPNLGLFTPNTREFFSKWVVTDAQQDNELRELERAAQEPRIFKNQDRAVIRFPIRNRHNSPYFLRKNLDGWMLDFASMSQIIGFNHKNQWFFRTKDHPFMFAFQDIAFDSAGFPGQRKQE
jgi:hypothetical protein